MSERPSIALLPRPGPIGRGLRLLLGIGTLYLFWGLLHDLPRLADGANLANPLTWLGLAYVVYVLPELAALAREVVPLPASGRSVRLAGAAGFAVLAGIDLAVSGSPNGAFFGLGLGLALSTVLAIVGGSLLLAALAAAPG